MSALMAAVRVQMDPVGPYDLRLVAHGATDPTRQRRKNVLELVFKADDVPSYGRVTQARQGRLEVELESEAPEMRIRPPALPPGRGQRSHPFLRAFARDPLIGEATRRFQGMRPRPTPLAYSNPMANGPDTPRTT